MNERQIIWDRMLLHIFLEEFSWGLKYDTKMLTLVRYFYAATGTSIEGLKRIPADGHMSVTVRRFICGYLPRLARILIDKEKTHDDVEALVKDLQRWSIDTLACDPLQAKDRKFLRQEKSAYDFACLQNKRFAEAVDTANAQQAASGLRVKRRRRA